MKQFALALALCTIIACQKENNKNVSTDTQTSDVQVKAIFEQIDAATSGITFANRLQENVGTLENLFDFDYFYNGAGIAVLDINNDGLQDLFFTGNQVPNALYLNKGNLQFEDISATAGINQGKEWSNGVTVADVNNDGWMDIYVSQGGPKQAAQRKNLLFINLKNNRFRESAAQYNLADTGISTQSSFFDFDKDGDLDLVVSNENEFYGLDPQRFFKTMDLPGNLEKSSVQLYQNEEGQFTNITKKAGIQKPAFGLGLIVSDINNDGWLDFYIANDYYVPDAMYINNQDGTFTDRIKEYTKQVSFYGMGVDIADINNDNLQDIFVLDMAASDHVRSKTLMASMDEARFNMLVEDFDFPYQYMFNSLQLNVGNNKFHNVVQQAHLAKTDWSWAGLLADLDNDSRRDIYVTNGYRRYALDNDLQNQVRDTQQAFNGKVPLNVKQKLYDAMPTEKLSNIMFQNQGDLDFKNVAYQWGLAVASYSNGAVYADLDNDGDLELVVNNIDDTAFLFKNTAVEQKRGNFLRVQTMGMLSEPFAKITIALEDGTEQIAETKRTRGYLSATEPTAHFGLGAATQIASVEVQWLSGKSQTIKNVDANQTIVVSEADAIPSGTAQFKQLENEVFYTFKKVETGLQFDHKENAYNDFTKEVLLPYKQSTLGPHLSKADVNGDGLDDVFIGGASGQASSLFVQTQTGFSEQNVLAFQKDAQYEDMGALFTDVDGDGDKDLIVTSGGNEAPSKSEVYQNRLYLNDANGNFIRSGFVEDAASSKVVRAVDFDNDGDEDILIGNRISPQQFPVSAPSKLYRNDKGVFVDVTKEIAPDLLNFGIINDLLITDFNKDGAQDFIAVGEWSHIGMFENTDGIFRDVSKEYGVSDEKGWWFSITETDLNKDGFPDYIVGNIGSNVKYTASKEQPFKVFANDFDDNGTWDLVLSKQYNGNYVPARGKECSTQQMPFISQKFQTYNAFANATLADIYGDKLETAYEKEVTSFHSKLLLNRGDGSFEVKNLPALAQRAPILATTLYDFDGDGHEDILVAGAIYNAEVETPRYDAGTGTLLLSNTEDGYNAVPVTQTDVYLEGNVKSLLKVTHKGLGEELIIVGVNNGPSATYSLNQ